MADLTDPALEYIEDICLRMRERDRVEILNVRPYNNALTLAWEAWHSVRNYGRCRVGWHDGRPQGLVAFTESWPGVWNVWMFGTDDFKSVAADLVRWARREAKDILTVCEGRRCQCESMVGYDEAHKMLLALGAKKEGPPMLGWGKDGSAYQRFVWLGGADEPVLKSGFVRADGQEEANSDGDHD